MKLPIKIDGLIPVTFLRQDNSVISYTPVLDLSTCGKTYEEAKQRFAEALEIFFEELVEAETLEEVLFESGWEHTARGFRPPEIVANENFSPQEIPALAA